MSFKEYIQNRMIKQNKNWMGVFVGQETGIGKSWAALSMANKFATEFTLDDLAFSAREFMARIQYYQNAPLKGQIIIWDEAGLKFGSREFMYLSNRIISYVIQSFRYLNLGVIFTLPNTRMFDINARRLINLKMQVVGVNAQNEAMVNLWERKTVYPEEKAIWVIPTVHGDKLKRIFLPKPPDNLIAIYEEKKEKFMKEFYKEIDEELEEFEKKGKESIIVPLEFLDEFKQEIRNFKLGAGKRREYLVMEWAREFNAPIDTIYKWIQ